MQRIIEFIFLSLIVLCFFGCTHPEKAAQKVTAGARVITIDKNAWAGSSVNVLAGVRQTLYTRGNVQYAAYYNAQAQLVIAKRQSDSTNWQKYITPYSGNVVDAHNHISLVVDGNGFLHIAWDHHNNPLNYARSIEPGGLELKRQPMAQTLEQSVTYPQFYQLPSGDLLFQYRDGGSGRGTLVMNQYNVDTQTWQRLHSALIDGEGQRSAYWDMAIDARGVVHLAWIWRENPDVASNHDIAYARSNDGGKTWLTDTGNHYQLPITLSNAHVVKHIPQNHKLMNPPVVAADEHSNPFIASYWADTPNASPRYRVLFMQNGHWQEISTPPAPENFTLSGMGTKRPPWSRAALLVETSPDTERKPIHLVYRDDFHSGRVIASTIDNWANPQWRHRFLTSENVGAWEPSIDPQQWNKHKRAHMLLQKVNQQDGNDAQAKASTPSAIQLLEWVPE